MPFERIVVFGAGTMGHGIAQVCAEAGHDVIVREVSDAALAKGLGSIDKFLSKSVEKGKMTADEQARIQLVDRANAIRPWSLT